MPAKRYGKIAREIFQEATGVTLSSRFHVHHIDSDKNNNRIFNLVAIPNDVHSKYHFWKRELCLQLGRFMDQIDCFLPHYGAFETETIAAAARSYQEIWDVVFLWVQRRDDILRTGSLNGREYD
jgi:hypothetical protein